MIMNGNFLDHDQDVFIVDASCAKWIRFICYLNKLNISVSMFEKNDNVSFSQCDNQQLQMRRQ